MIGPQLERLRPQHLGKQDLSAATFAEAGRRLQLQVGVPRLRLGLEEPPDVGAPAVAGPASAAGAPAPEAMSDPCERVFSMSHWTHSFRVSGAIETATSTLAATASEFETATDEAALAAAAALRQAEAALVRARAAVKLAVARSMGPLPQAA
jgi:hypothetical protein